MGLKRIKEMITKLKDHDFYLNSHRQCQRKCIENSMENTHSDVKV